MKYNKEDILSPDELKNELHKILQIFAKYCDDNGLMYYLSSGTLLGAIRHKGFIPWDDDIDVYMPREDFDRLHEIIKTTPMPDTMELVSLKNGNGYYPFARIENTNVIITNSKTDLHNNLWMDIFPIDGIPTLSEKELHKINKKLSRWAFLLENACCEIGAGKTPLRKFVKTFVIIYAKLHGKTYYAKKLDEYARSNKIEDCEMAGDVVWGAIKYKTYKEYYGNPVQVEFEGKMYNAPEHYDEYLKAIYGDYMKLPPVEQRVNHSTEVIKLDKLL